MKTSSPTESASLTSALQTRAATIVLWIVLAIAVVLLLLAWSEPLVSVKVSARLPVFIPEPFQSFTILDETRSVVTMIERLWETHYRLIAVLLMFFGIALPVVKNLGVAFLLAAPPSERARRFAAVLQFVGRFAMVDIFAIAIVVSIMAAGTIGQGDNGGSPAAVDTVTQLRHGFYLFVTYILVSFAMDVALTIRYRTGGT